MSDTQERVTRKKSKRQTGFAHSVGGRAISKAEQKSFIGANLDYDEDGVVLVEGNHSTENVIGKAMRAKKARRNEIFGFNVTEEEVKKKGPSPASKNMKTLTKKIKLKKNQLGKTPTMIPTYLKKEESKQLILNALTKNILFNDCTKEQLDAIILAMKPAKVARNFTLIKEGTDGFNFYVVNKGVFEFSKNGEKIGEAKGGDSFGELALLYHAPRATTVRAVTPAEVWKIRRQVFRHILDQSIQSKESKVRQGIENCKLFEELPRRRRDDLIDICHFQTFNAGDVVIRKGDIGKLFYVVVDGRVQITKAGDFEDLNDTIFGPGDYFGEGALLSETRERMANVIAVDDNLELLVIDKEDFDRHLGSLVDILDHNLGMRILQSVDLLNELDRADFSRLCDLLTLEFFEENQVIINEGDQGDKFYIVKSGVVEVVKEGISVAKLSRGGFFGEMSLLSNDPRTATVVSATPNTQCFVLGRETFEEVFGPLKSISHKAKSRGQSLRKSVASAKSDTSDKDTIARKLRLNSERKSSYYSEIKTNMQRNEVVRNRHRIALEDLKMVTVLGTGTFGRVKLVLHEPTNQTYALKILQKQQIVQYRQQENVMNEKLVMQQSSHPFILKLYQTYKDKNCLYMLIELVQGGELFTLLHNQRARNLSNAQSRFYAGCVVDAILYLHNLSIVYRDLKPENLMIDAEGYIKVVDFGFAKRVRQKTYTLCGTPEYLAPELVLQKGHNRAVDYWAIGVLIYEMLTGGSPFADPRRNDHITICRNIVRLRYDFPRTFPKHAKNIVQRLLQRHPHERLGMERDGSNEMKKHEWFKELDWVQLRARELQTPWKPNLDNNLDVSNFEEYDEDEEDIMEYIETGENWDNDF
eukprot:maker-scaffold_53-snap-gene-1.1-mRNA-1 protein AED:0.07 eAED:0.07 QI:0/1/0.5/1/1/1/2/172/868